MNVKRMWINQPSTLQQHHNLHGINVLVVPENNRPVSRVYFLNGDVISMEIANICLSDGWLK